VDDSWFVTVSIDGVPVDFRVDTGAKCNVLPWSIFDNVVRLKQLKPSTRVMTYNRQPMHVVGHQQLATWFITVTYFRLVVFWLKKWMFQCWFCSTAKLSM
jgi:hypothetical protein